MNVVPSSAPGISNVAAEGGRSGSGDDDDDDPPPELEPYDDPPPLDPPPPKSELPKLPPLLCAAAKHGTDTARAIAIRRTRSRYLILCRVSLKERRPRFGCAVLSLVASPFLAFGAAGAIGIVVPPDEVPESVAQRAFDREARASARLGMSVASDRTERLGAGDTERRMELALEPGECVAITAAAWGYVTVERVAIAEREDLVRGETHLAVAQAAEWCTETARTLAVRVDLSASDAVLGRDEYTGGGLRWQVARGRVEGSFASLTRGVPTARGARSLSRAAYLRMGDRRAAGRPALAPAIEIAAHRARLIPESRAAYERLRDLAENDTGEAVTPRWDALPDGVPAAWRPNDRPSVPGVHPAIAFDDGDARRVLLVLRPSSLGADCATVQLVRMTWGYDAAVERLDGRSVQRHHNVASDRVCRSTTSMIVYTAPPADHSRYLLRIFEG